MACTETVYINSATNLLEQITRYDAIIKALGERVVDAAAGTADIDEYQLDDSQVRIRTKYRSVEAIADAILKFERLRNIAMNKLNGRNIKLNDWRGMI